VPLLSTALPEAELTVVSVSVLPLICPLIRLVRSTVLLCPTVSLPVAAGGPGSTVMLTLPVVRG
jgi:hypothetical protein